MSLFEELARRAAAAGNGPNVSDIPEPDRDAYAEYGRPALAMRLGAIGLNHSFVRAEGDRLSYDEGGVRREVLDMVGGAGSALFGHNHPELVGYARALLDARVPQHAQVSNRAYAGMLARTLSEKLEASTGRTFVGAFANTGTEAVEAAIAHAQMEMSVARDRLLSTIDKDFALSIHGLRGVRLRLSEDARELLAGKPELLPAVPEADSHFAVALQERVQAENARTVGRQPLLLAIDGSFHGMTAGSLSLTFNPDMREPFEAPRLRTTWIPADDPDAATRTVEQEIRTVLRLVISDSGEIHIRAQPWCGVLALFVEPVQGEGGVHVLHSDFLAYLRALADRYGFPIVVDEIQSGMGRCGAFTASERVGLRGDYYLFAKALGGGLAKVAVAMIDRERYQPKFGWIRGSTFAEDELGCLLALRALEILDRDGLALRCEDRGRTFREKLLALKRRYPGVVRDVRGSGLMIGFELAEQAASPSRLIRVMSDAKGLGAFASGYLFHEEQVRVMNTSSSPNTLRLEPSAYIDAADIDHTVSALERLCRTIECANAGRLVRHIAQGTGPGRAREGAAPFIEDWRDRHSPPDEMARPGEPRVAFLGYPVESWRLGEWDASLSPLSREAYEELLRAWNGVVPPQVTQRMRVRTPGGKTVHLTYIALLLSSEMFEAEMRAGHSDALRDQVDEAVELARSEGCDLIGFGGLTSVVTHNCRRAARTDIGLTTGNALTVGMGMQAIVSGASGHGVDLGNCRAGVVGAAGNIASVYARMLARHVPELVMVGRRHSLERLRTVAARIYADAFDSIRAGSEAALGGVAAALARTGIVQDLAALPSQPPDVGRWMLERLSDQLGDRAPIQIADGLDSLSTCRVIVSASNSTSPIIYPEHLASGPVLICDIAVPPDVAPEVLASRPDVVVLSGGVVRIPGNERLKTFANPLPEGHMYACMAETVLLGLMEQYEHFSFGDIEPAQVELIMSAAKAHGFECGDVRAS